MAVPDTVTEYHTRTEFHSVFSGLLKGHGNMKVSGMFLSICLLFLAEQVAANGHTQTEEYGDIHFMCPEDWTIHKGNCYKAIDIPMNYVAAALTCMGQGGHLYYAEDEIEYLDYVATLLPDKTIWFANRKVDGKWMLGESEVPLEYLPKWGNNQPDETDTDNKHVVVHPENFLMLTDGDKMFPFVCKQRACMKGYTSCDLASKCIPQNQVCNGLPECVDGRDENNCPERGTQHLHLTSGNGQFSSENLKDFDEKVWILEAPVAKRIKLEISQAFLETNCVFCEVWTGGPTFESSELLKRFTGSVSRVTLYSSTNFMTVRMFSKDCSSSGRITFSWTTDIDEIDAIMEEKTATDNWQCSAIPFASDEFKPKDLVLWWNIAAAEGEHIIYYVDVTANKDYSNDEVQFKIMAEMEDLKYRDFYISSSNMVSVISYYIPKNGRVSLCYKKGCDLETDTAYGRILTPQPIPNNFVCSWTLTSGQDVNRGMSLKFEKLDLAKDPRTNPGISSMDSIMVYPDESEMAMTGISEGDIVHAPEGSFKIELKTDPAFMSAGAVIRFGRDCEALMLSAETEMSTNMTYIFEDVELSCPKGYVFHMEKYKTEDSVTLTCSNGGWRIEEKDPGAIPKCQPVFCGPPQKIENGGVESATKITFEGVVTYFCNDGFNMNGNAEAKCNDVGVWEDVPTCTSSSCPEFNKNSIPNGDFEIIKGNEFSAGTADYNTVIQFSCDEGYELLGAMISHCNTSGWTHLSNPPSCIKIACTVPIVPNSNVNLGGVTDKIFYGETFSVECDENYQFSSGDAGSISILCQANRTFDQSPVCEDIDECKEGKSLCVEATTTCMNTDGGYICNCKSGFKRESEYSCTDIIECDDEKAGCSYSCNNEPGSYNCECDEGYQLFEGDGFNGFTLPQGETGLLRGDRYYVNHTCVPVQCPELDSVTNGKYLTNSLSNFHYGDTVTLQCEDGYFDGSGASFISTCKSDGTWDDIRSCEARECSLPSTPSYGAYDKTKVLFEETLTLTCNLTETRKITRRAICIYENDGVRFAGDDITQCPEIDCGNPDMVMPVGGTYNGARPSTTTYFGSSSSFTFTCNSGFDVTGASSDVDNDKNVKCKANGRWGFGSLACTGKMCKDPGTPGDAQQDFSGYEIGSTLSYTCDREGFTITEPEEYMCNYNSGANSADWSDNLAQNLPECKDTEKPKFSGDCGKTIDLDAMDRVFFNQGTATDNFRIKSFSRNNDIQSGDRLISSTSVTYTAVDFEDNTETCTINFNVINRDDKPELSCPNSKTIKVSARESNTYDTSSDITVTGGEFVTTPASITVNVGKIGTVEKVTAIATNEDETQSTCTFLVDFVANACFQEQLFVDTNAIRSCSEVGSNLVCTSTCRSNNLYSDKTNEKNFTCSGTGTWDYANTQPHDRFCLTQQTPEYEVDVSVTHQYASVTGGCGTQYRAFVEANVGTFETNIRILCDGIEWDVSVVSAKPVTENIVLFEAEFRLKLITRSASPSAIEECLGEISNDTTSTVFNPGANRLLTCSSTTSLPVTTSSVSATEPETRCSTDGFQLDGTICLSYGPGQYYNTDTNSVADCPVGEYQDNLAQTSCKTCPDGEYPNSDQTGCQDTCSNGFKSNNGFYPCEPCPPDQYWQTKDTCAECPNGGSTVGDEGATKCYDPCPIGTFSLTGYNVNGCTSCHVNFYQDQTGQEACKECNANQITTSTGSISSSNCTDIEDVCDAAYCNDIGTCSFKYHRRECTCNSGYYGDKCQFVYHICDGNPCTNGATCVKGVGLEQYTCTCRTDLDECKMEEQGTSKSGPNDPPPFDSPSAATASECNTKCLANADCKDLIVLPTGNTVLCVMYNVELTPSQLSEGNGQHVRKVCDTAFDGDHCEVDTDDNCADAACSENSECMDKIDGFKCVCPSAGGFKGQFCTIANNPCSPDPCDRGSCDAFGSVRYECTCIAGYTGLNCSEQIDECTVHPLACPYDGKCVDLVNDYRCDCKSGFSGGNCQNTPNFCNSQNCGIGNICYSSLNRMEGACVCDMDLFEPRYRCAMAIKENEGATLPNTNFVGSPLSGSLLENCETQCQENADCMVANFLKETSLCILYNGSYVAKENVESVAIHKDCNDKPAEAYTCERMKQPCDDVDCNNGTCQNINNGLDSSCSCDTGFTGSLCQHSIDDCVGNTCKNGAECVDGHQTYTCNCAAGYEGPRCDVNTDDCPGCCNTTYATCVDEVNGYKCDCNDGYTGEDCDIEINECASHPCQHGGECMEEVNGFECQCAEGWEGTMCDRRKNFCQDRNCNDGKCFSLDETSFCRCEGGATGQNCENATLLCHALADIDICVNEGICLNRGGTAECACPVVYDVDRCFMEDGLLGKSGVNLAKRSIKEQLGPGLTAESCQADCLNNPICAGVTFRTISNSLKICVFYNVSEEKLTDAENSIHFSRNCPTDFVGKSCECVVDWCARKPCKHGGKCIPLGPVGYDCECEPGYSGPTCEKVANPCDSNPCLGRAVCQSTASDYICQCKGGTAWTGSSCRTCNTDYTMLVNAVMANQAPPHLKTTFKIDSNQLSVMLSVRVHYSTYTVPLSTLFALVVTPNLQWTAGEISDFSLTLSRFGVYVTYRDSEPVGIVFDEDFGDILFDGEWHHVGISIDSDGMLSATIDALTNSEPVNTSRPFSLDYNAQIFLGYGYIAEYQLVEVYDKYLDKSVFAEALENKRPDIQPIQSFCNYEVVPTARLNVEPLSEIIGEKNPNQDVPVLNCEAVEDVYYTTAERLTSASSIEDLNDIINAVQTGSDLIYKNSLVPTLTWSGCPVIITGKNETTGNYGECRFNLYVRYNSECPAVIADSSVSTPSCPINSNTNSICGVSCSSNSQQLAAPTPNYLICGTLGVFDYRTPFADVTLPSCMTPVAAAYQLSISMQFTLDISCASVSPQTLQQLEDKLRQNFKEDVKQKWNNVCTDDDCTNLQDLKYECDPINTKRVSVMFSLNLLSTTVSAVGGGNVENVEALRLIILVDKDIDVETVVGAILIETTVQIHQRVVCAAGNRLAESEDVDVCVPCSEGMYLKDGNCVPCDYGYYQDKTAQETCTKCEGEKTTYQKHSKSSTDCKEICEAGNYYDEKEGKCKTCMRHFYQPEDGKNFCLPCAIESKTVEEGSDSASDCKADCPPGEQRSAETGLCSLCDRGYWRSLQYDDCQVCPSGKTTFIDEHAKTESDCAMDICELGEYFDVDADPEGKCEPCAEGYFQDELYMLDCKRCPGNKTTEGTGSESETDCKFYCAPGYEQQNATLEVCLPCERRQYKDNIDDSKFEGCKTCPGDTTDMMAATSKDNCSIPICAVGEIIDEEKKCKPCDIDTYSDDEFPTTQTKCISCGNLNGTADTGSMSGDCRRYCEAGKFLNGDTCEMCARGYYKDNEGLTRFENCIKCPNDDGKEKTTNNVGAGDESLCNVYKCSAGSIHTSTGCQECDFNTFQTKDHPLSSDTCQSCQPRDGLTTNTKTKGSDSQEDCFPICPKGQFLVNKACVICPRGTYKDNDGDSKFGNCTECTGDTTTEGEGSESEDLCNIPKCDAGQYLVENKCTDCPQDFYSAVMYPNSALECIKCASSNGVDYGTEADRADSAELCKPICPGGKQFGSDMCKDCGIGFYKEDADRFGTCKSCETVNSGYVTSGPGANTSAACNLRDCPAGQKIVGGNSCEACPIGTYQNEPRKTTCIECGENLSTDGEGKTSEDDCQIECGPGLEGTESCSKCPVTKFKTDAGYSNCEDCPVDRRANTARTVCDVVFCSVGKDYSESGSTKSCTECQIGYFKNQEGNDQQCTLCPEGKTTNGTGQASCDLLYCVAGRYESEGKCDLCPVGTYKADAGNQECTECPEKSTTGVEGATDSTQCDIVVCDPGEYRKSDQKTLCTKCEVNTYQPSAGETECIDCKDNKITLEDGRSSESDCVSKCLKGQEYNTTTKQCTLCPSGSYKDVEGNVEPCQSCPQDKTTAGRGSTAESDCSENVCPPGKYFEVINNKVVCFDCPLGQYSDRTLQKECTACPDGKTTQAVGSDSEEDCVDNCEPGHGYLTYGSKCEICPKGQYNDEQGKNPNTCKLCPSGKTNSQAGSVSCSFDAPVFPVQFINFRLTICIQVALDSCDDTNSIGLILNRLLDLLRNLFQETTNQRYNGSNKFCTSANCGNARLYSSSPKCDEIGGKKRAISHSLCIEFVFDAIRQFITDTEADDANIDAVQIISLILKLNGPVSLSDPDREIFFVSFSNITTSDICILGQELVDDTCIQCPAGKFAPEVGKCEMCPINQYQNETGQNECKPCPQKSYTENKMGSTSISDCTAICQAGFEFKNSTKTCSECLKGFYKADAGNDEACTKCSADRTTKSTGSTSPNDCSETVCVAGQYIFTEVVTGQVQCRLCAIGTYNPDVMAEQCETCPDGKTTLQTGRKALGDCIPICGAGRGYASSIDGCLTCPKGQFNDGQDPNPNSCKLCPATRTNLKEGESSCNIEVVEPDVPRRRKIRFRFTLKIQIVTCEDADLNNIRTTYALRIRTLMINARNKKYNRNKSFCSANCANLFVVFATNDPLGSCKSARRRRALSHELSLDVEFRNVTEGTVDNDTGAEIQTEEAINQILKDNEAELSPNPGEIEFKLAESQPECTAGEQLVSNDCVACTTGRYSTSGDACEMCPKDTYQDESGQSSCKDCPATKFYDKTGATASSACVSYCARNPTYCNGKGVCSDTGRRTASCSCTENYEGATCTVKKEPQSDLPAILGGAIGGGAALLFIILIAVGLIYRCSRGPSEKRKGSYHDPEFIQNGAYEGNYDNFGYHDGQARPIAPYPSVGYPAIGYKPDTSFEDGSYARAYKYRPSVNDDDRRGEDTQFMWTA